MDLWVVVVESCWPKDEGDDVVGVFSTEEQARHMIYSMDFKYGEQWYIHKLHLNDTTWTEYREETFYYVTPGLPEGASPELVQAVEAIRTSREQFSVHVTSEEDEEDDDEESHADFQALFDQVTKPPDEEASVQSLCDDSLVHTLLHLLPEKILQYSALGQAEARITLEELGVREFLTIEDSTHLIEKLIQAVKDTVHPFHLHNDLNALSVHWKLNQQSERGKLAWSLDRTGL